MQIPTNMEPTKQNPIIISCTIALFLILNPFLLFSHAQQATTAPPPPSSPFDFLKTLTSARKGTPTKGISQLKSYLSRFGYMSNEPPANLNNDMFDDPLEQAIKLYQSFFKLEPTGFLDEKTVNAMAKTRCGVPDDPKSAKNHEIEVGSRMMNPGSYYSFPSGQPKWPPNRRNLTYSFPAGTRPDVNDPIRNAMDVWSRVSPITFTYISNYNAADVKISFQVRDHGDGYPFDGPLGVLAHASYPTGGQLHFDGDEKWVDGIVDSYFDLQTVGLHELGHIIGLGHSDDGGSIMYPFIGNGVQKLLNPDDIDAVEALYK